MVILLNHTNNTFKLFKTKTELYFGFIANKLKISVELVEENIHMFNYEEVDLIIDSEQLEIVKIK